MKTSYEPVRGYFPYRAVLSVTLCLFANNYAITSCFAYTGAMVVHLGAASNRDEAGYAAGLLASSFMVGRGVTALVWGILADKFGRRPVLLVCCFAMTVFQLTFGFATSFGAALASRFFLGFFNGLVGTSKTAVAELVPGDDVKLQSKAMGILGGAVSFGQLLGPSIGGWLADPVQQYPENYDQDSYLKSVPFILPNVVGACFALLSAVCVYFFLPETRSVLMPQHRQALASNDGGDEKEQHDVQHDFLEIEMASPAATNEESSKESSTESSKESSKKSFSSKQTISSPGILSSVFSFCADWRVLWPCLVYSFHSLNSMWLNEVFPLWCLGSTRVGGLSMSLYEIGLLVSISSILLVIFQAIGFHRLVNHFSPSKVFIGGALFMVPFVFLTPLTASMSVEMNYTFSDGGDGVNMTVVQNVTVLNAAQATQRGWMFIVVGFLRGMSSLVSVTTFSTSFMLINNSCSNDDRGAVNGLAMTIASVTKAIGPAVGSSLLAWSFTQGKDIAWVLGRESFCSLFFFFPCFFLSIFLLTLCITLYHTQNTQIP